MAADVNSDLGNALRGAGVLAHWSTTARHPARHTGRLQRYSTPQPQMQPIACSSAEATTRPVADNAPEGPEANDAAEEPVADDAVEEPVADDAAEGPVADAAPRRRPMEISDSRFERNRAARVICCDECRYWYRDNGVGTFWHTRGMPNAEFRKAAWERGDWDASWYCIECCAKYWECSKKEVMESLGFS